MDPLGVAAQAVLKPSSNSLSHQHVVKGCDFEDAQGNVTLDYKQITSSFLTTGYQATNVGVAIDIITGMLNERRKPFEEDTHTEDEFIRRKSGCTIFLGYTSNIISSGLRDTIRFLVKHKLVDCLVTTAGGVEEDLIKSLKDCKTYVGKFDMSGKKLRAEGINRIGNLLVPNDNYCRFEEWILPIFDKMLQEQKENNFIWTPSKMIERLGLEINDEQSVCYWAAKNKIPIFSPALTDGSLGDMLYFHSFRSPGLIVDINQDIRRINTIPHGAIKTGAIVIGGGICKHHIMNANLMRNGADYSVYINTGLEFDGSDAGAEPDEAISWGKILPEAKAIKVHSDATIVLPLIVAETFVKYLQSEKC